MNVCIRNPEIWSKSANKKRVLGISVFIQKPTQPPIRPPKSILKYKFYCDQKHWLCTTVPTQQSTKISIAALKPFCNPVLLNICI